MSSHADQIIPNLPGPHQGLNRPILTHLSSSVMAKVNLRTYLNLAPMLKMRGDTPPLLHGGVLNWAYLAFKRTLCFTENTSCPLWSPVLEWCLENNHSSLQETGGTCKERHFSKVQGFLMLQKAVRIFTDVLRTVKDNTIRACGGRRE
jgi:hypothetical protein